MFQCANQRNDRNGERHARCGPAESSDATASPSAFVARQAVFDRQGDLWAYELLFRSCEENCYTGTEQSLATIQVLSTSLFSIGLDRLLSGRPALINFGRELLLTDWSTVLPADVAIIEILEDVVSDPEILLKCAALRKCGYRIALDDFVPGEKTEPSFPSPISSKSMFGPRPSPNSGEFCRAISRAAFGCWPRRSNPGRVPDRPRDGFDSFRGSLRLPGGHVGKTFPWSSRALFALMRELQYPRWTIVESRNCAKRRGIHLQTAALRQLRAFGKTRAISSVSQALIYLGEADIRKWIGVAVMDVCSRGKSRNWWCSLWFGRGSANCWRWKFSRRLRRLPGRNVLSARRAASPAYG